MNKFLPSPEKVSQEILATAIAVIFVAYLVAKVPPLKKLVKEYSVD
jgi:uncharacterized membrane protein